MCRRVIHALCRPPLPRPIPPAECALTLRCLPRTLLALAGAIGRDVIAGCWYLSHPAPPRRRAARSLLRVEEAVQLAGNVLVLPPQRLHLVLPVIMHGIVHAIVQAQRMPSRAARLDANKRPRVLLLTPRLQRRLRRRDLSPARPDLIMAVPTCPTPR